MATIIADFAWGTGDALAAPPSFDCAIVKAVDQIAICQNDELSRLDWQVWRGWQAHRKQAGKAVANEYAKLTLVDREACGSDFECIKNVQMRAIEFYKFTTPSIPEPQPMLRKQTKPANSSATAYPSDYKELVLRWLLPQLKDPQSVEVALITLPKPSKYWAGIIFGGTLSGYEVCITYNAKNSFGGYVGFKTLSVFIRNGKVYEKLIPICTVS